MSNDTDTPGTAMPVVVAYCTEAYVAEAERLRASVERHGLEVYLERIPDQGGWLANTGYKPRFVRECLERFAGRSVLYLDADGEMRRYPKLLESYAAPGSCDVAVHYRFRLRREPELMSGTIYLANTLGCRRVVDAWLEEQSAHPEVWDQRNLQAVLDRLRGTVEVRDLPPSYCQIEGWSRPGKLPVILHRIAPRQRRRKPRPRSVARPHSPR